MMRSIVLLITTILSVVASGLTLVHDGKSDYTIVLPARASPSEKRAANELQSYIEQISGAKLPIQNDDKLAPPHAILLGRNARLKESIPFAKLGPEGFTLKTSGDTVMIAGSNVRGTMYGVDELLEKLGVRWFTASVTRVPKMATIEIPSLDETQIPAFEYREPYFVEAWDKDWAAHNRVNGSSPKLDESTGGKVAYYPFCHSFDMLIPQDLFKTHPEYFPLIKGKRTGGYVQRCLTNPDVQRLAIKTVRRWIEKEQPQAQIYSVTQNDTANWCECDVCKKIQQKYGGISGYNLWFANRIAEAIEEDHPDKLIDTFAYQDTEPAPKNIVPRKNVRVRICPIYACESHLYEHDSDPGTKKFLKALDDWSAITDTLYVWHYCTNFSHYLMPFADFKQFPDSIRLYKEHKVRGVFLEGAYAGLGGGSDAELRSYVMAKCLWNEKTDADAIVTEWMQGVYGAGWKPMRQWFDLLHEKASDPAHHLHVYEPIAFYLTDDVLAKGDAYFDEAEKLAASDSSAMKNLRKARLWLRYTMLEKKPGDAKELADFVKTCQEFGISHVAESKSLDMWAGEMAKRK
ncbi:MAG TPA: DUF4838 domain-containing protein [Tepidisphaeraceae bacterium]|nr:DUF4838 domain-containing protein [Tepidisphaeraceae bacterium]